VQIEHDPASQQAGDARWTLRCSDCGATWSMVDGGL
jgi:hypothetical protein